MVLKKNLKKKKQAKIKETTIDDLAIMIGKGFKHVEGRINSLEREQEKTKEEIKEFRRENYLEHEEMKIRFDNVAHRFELVELQKRVGVLEGRAMV
ncbi:MAG: hypothetical protein KAQ87_01855 [Candidatus Pacebacteria bacterium]|nr:hypothetical protein [Candidatus Paceibacterota bacterium]